MEAKIRENDENDLSGKNELEIQNREEFISSIRKSCRTALDHSSSIYRVNPLGRATQEHLYKVGFDFTGSMIRGQQQYAEVDGKLKKISKSWTTVPCSRGTFKRSLSSILDKTTTAHYKGRTIGDKFITVGGRIFKHSKLVAIDIDAHGGSSNNIAVLTRVIELLRCQESCYVEESVEENNGQRGFHLYLKVEDYVRAKTWENLVSIIKEEFGTTIEVFSKETTRAIRYPFDWGYQTAGFFENGTVVPVCESMLEALTFIQLMPSTRIPNEVIFYKFQFGRRIEIKREIQTEKKLDFIPRSPSERYPYRSGTRWNNQLAIGFACIRQGKDFLDFVSECRLADFGSKDMASSRADIILEQIWEYCVAKFDPRTPDWIERKVVSSIPRQEYSWKDRELTEEEAEMFSIFFVNRIRPLMGYKKRTPAKYKEQILDIAKALYSFFLEETEFTLQEKKRIYLDKRLSHLSDYVDIPMKEFNAFCKHKNLPFETVKRLLKIFEDVGLVHVGRDSSGRRYRKGHFCTHYKLIPIAYLIRRSFPMDDADVSSDVGSIDGSRLSSSTQYNIDEVGAASSFPPLIIYKKGRPPPNRWSAKGIYLRNSVFSNGYRRRTVAYQNGFQSDACASVKSNYTRSCVCQ